MADTALSSMFVRWSSIDRKNEQFIITVYNTKFG